MPSHILAKASAAAVVASLALASGAQAHSSNGVEYTLRVSQVERELDRHYGDRNSCVTRRGSGSFYRSSHFVCADGEQTFTVHVLRRGFRLSNLRSY